MAHNFWRITGASLLLLAGCAGAPPDQRWVRLDGQAVERPDLVRQRQADLAICRAYAVNAGTAIQVPPPAARTTVDVTTNVYAAAPGNAPLPGSYQPPLMDFSGLSDTGGDIGTSMQRSEVVRTNMASCMAQRGYILQKH
jgi:hypothetical protein